VLDPAAGILVVVAEGERQYALLVDELLGQQQFVAKSVRDGLATVPGIAGAAVRSDGGVGLILDPVGIIAQWSSRVAPG
jgi:two-component system, chemotaxis family, sensor kinase CheA